MISYHNIIARHREYYCLIASLEEYSLDSSGQKLNPQEVRRMIKAELSSYDKKAVELLYTHFDIENLLRYATSSNLPFNQLGNLSQEQIAKEVDATASWLVEDDDAEPFVSELPDSIALLVDRYKGRIPLNDDNEPTLGALSLSELETELYTQFYKLCDKSGNKFLKKWSLSDRTIRNIVAATRAKAMAMDPEKVVIGHGPWEEMIRSNAAADFGLREDFEWTSDVLSVLETEDFVEREHRMDALRWKITEALCEQEYFSIDVLLAYLIKVNIIHRWSALDPEVGRGRFGEIVETLTRTPEA